MLQNSVSALHHSYFIYEQLIAGTPIFVILLTLGVFLFWLLSEYILLSVRGVKREEMGRLGEMVDGIGLIAQGISLIAKGNGIICCGNGGGDKVCPPPYQVSCPYLLSTFLTHFLPQFSPRTMGFGDGGGDPGDVGAQVHPPYQVTCCPYFLSTF